MSLKRSSSVESLLGSESGSESVQNHSRRKQQDNSKLMPSPRRIVVRFSDMICYRSFTRRSVNLLIGGMLFFVGLLLVISSSSNKSPLSTKNSHHSSAIDNDFPDSESRQAAVLINQQLKRIEESLHSNRLIINDLRDEMNRFRDNLVGQAQPPITSVFSQTHQRLSKRMCSAAGILSATAELPGDINMQAVYENLTFDNPDGGVWKQGWPLSYKEDDFQNGRPLNVIVMPHSHNDPGWIKTFDTYFEKQTKKILDSAVDKLTSEPKLKFVWAESSYMSKWMDGASENDRLRMKNLVQNGQIELVTGGWVMNDEANTYYFSMLSQMIDGHEFIEDNFGVVPKHGWANDPFGLSPTMAYLLKKMGFRAMVIQRVHYSIKKYLASNKNLEFHWRQSFEADSDQDDILCHLEPFYSYDVPHTCGPDPKVCCQFDFKRLPGNKLKCPWKMPPVVITKENVAERAKLLLDQYRKKSTLYQTNTLLVPLGDDFRFDSPKEWNNQFDNYKRLMDHMNADTRMNVNIQFGTLSDYFDSLFEESVRTRLSHDTFSSLVGDFFTYADREDHYWSGYYTSKPFYKRFERVLQSHLRTTEILFSVANILSNGSGEDKFKSAITDLNYARQNLALFQHHDGITGTAKDFVVRDYAHRMFSSFVKLESVVSTALSVISGSHPKVPETEFLNRFPDDASPLKKKVFDVKKASYFVVHNSLGWTRDAELVCFDIVWDAKTNWCLADTTTKKQITDIQMNLVWNRPTSVDADTREVCFQPSIGPLALKQFCVGHCDCDANSGSVLNAKEQSVHLFNYHRSPESQVPTGAHILPSADNPNNLTIANDRFELTFNPESGMLQHSRFFQDGAWNELGLKMQLMTYGTRKGPKTVMKSGAYIFLPDQRNPEPFKSKQKPLIRVSHGPLESRIVISFLAPLQVEVKISLVRGRDSIDLDTKFLLAGFFSSNREFLVRLETPLDNQKEFYTDLNGFQMIARKFYEKIPIQGNVYPFNSIAFIENQNVRMNVLTAQPLGVTVANTGTMDIFLDRRLVQDDERGLSQGVVDNKFTHESFRIFVEKTNGRANRANPKSTSAANFESLSLLNPLFGIVAKQSNEQILARGEVNILQKELPCDIHLLNLRRFTNRFNEIGVLIHRLAFQCDCGPQYEFSFADILNSEVAAKLRPEVMPYTITFLQPLALNTSRLDQSLVIGRSHIFAYKLFNR